MKIVTIVGARPQFIKAAAVSRTLADNPAIQEVVVHTGQHFDENMSTIFFKEMAMREPDYHLALHSLSHGAMTGRMLEEIEKILILEKPDGVLVYGDTNSTLAGALAAKKLQIRVAHVESGLRSFNMRMPEEVNRVMTDRISDLLFCPTRHAVANLEREGFRNLDCKIVETGDVMLDAARRFAPLRRKPSGKIPDEFVLCTFHRAENTDSPGNLLEIVSALDAVATQIPVICPLHPRTKSQLKAYGYDLSRSPVVFIDPVGYLEMLWLLSNMKLILTDSGGLQKEAYFFGKYCLTLRQETEWTELVDHGVNFLTGTDRGKILATFQRALQSGRSDRFDRCIYGDGKASEKIVEQLCLS